jgi:hypothetical protein
MQADKKSYSGSGTTWTDRSGNGNSGTLTNGPTFDSGNGGSIDFDGQKSSKTITQRNRGLTFKISVIKNNGKHTYNPRIWHIF